ncbi:MAG: hypothetical protein DI526_11095 [Caulobacter segnis]|uniref:Uncharacterized protein n=1 Tax=Caulobacter segnis TaxID=88688 RepID=A0A2W5VFX6_9CAUL|nr:MAG: hypothetical protein DI526_11095 [Caulobacter segnis]
MPGSRSNARVTIRLVTVDGASSPVAPDECGPRHSPGRSVFWKGSATVKHPLTPERWRLPLRKWYRPRRTTPRKAS